MKSKAPPGVSNFGLVVRDKRGRRFHHHRLALKLRGSVPRRYFQCSADPRRRGRLAGVNRLQGRLKSVFDRALAGAEAIVPG
jgi:hypothetical protein